MHPIQVFFALEKGLIAHKFKSELNEHFGGSVMHKERERAFFHPDHRSSNGWGGGERRKEKGGRERGL